MRMEQNLSSSRIDSIPMLFTKVSKDWTKNRLGHAHLLKYTHQINLLMDSRPDSIKYIAHMVSLSWKCEALIFTHSSSLHLNISLQICIYFSFLFVNHVPPLSYCTLQRTFDWIGLDCIFQAHSSLFVNFILRVFFIQYVKM